MHYTEQEPSEATRGLLKCGAWCAYITGASYVFIVICAFMSPSSVASYVTSAQYFKAFKDYMPIFVALKLVMMVANGAMVGVVASFYALRRPKYHGVMTLFSLLAIIGLGVGMLQSIQDATVAPHLAEAYYAADVATQKVIIAFGVANPAIYGLSLGLPGIWFIIVSLLALSNPKIPRLLVLLGLIWGIGNITTVVAHVFVLIWLIYLVAFGALIAAPIWSIWEGIYLWRLAKRFD